MSDGLIQYLTPADVADLLRVPTARVLRWARTGVLPAITLPGGDVVIAPDDLKKWLQERREVQHATA